jgi:hypothetical protein
MGGWLSKIEHRRLVEFRVVVGPGLADSWLGWDNALERSLDGANQEPGIAGWLSFLLGTLNENHHEHHLLFR